MKTKIVTAILALFIAGIVCFSYSGGAQIQESQIDSVDIPSADSSTKKAVDSTMIIRDEFVAQKENTRDKVNYLQQQQRKIKETQKQIDSIISIKLSVSKSENP